ncbi:cytochrome c oxidase subunit IV-domain-containing protein [Melampsora americana]|nr:cytochrome c oxidase subunit IV-domain-containing protein [Melampsora americana]
MLRSISTRSLRQISASSKVALQLRQSIPSLSANGQTYATIAVPTDHSATGTSQSVPSISNIEAAWKEMTPQEQESIFHHLEGLQKKDWKQLSLDEKKASYWVSFGPHGPREPIHPPGSGLKLLLGITGCVTAGVATFVMIRLNSPGLPHTMSKEWQEASTERAKEQKMDPFTGASAEGKKARTFVQ